MKIEDFIKNVIQQITAACDRDGVYMPQQIEFTIQINMQGEVCTKDDIAIATIKVQM